METANKTELKHLISEAMQAEVLMVREEIRRELIGCSPEQGVKDIIEFLTSRFGISVDEFVSKHRQRYIVEARQVFCWLVRNQIIPNRLALSHIGMLIGGKDHATVLHSCRVIDNMNETDVAFRENMMRIINELGKKAVWNGKKLEIK